MTTIRLHELLGLRELPSSGLAWNDVLLEGLEQKALQSLSRYLGVTVQDLTSLILDAPLQEGERLPRHASNFMHRIAVALRQLQTAKGGDLDAAALWLRSIQPELKGRIPILLLQTNVGGEYVTAAISRIKPPAIKHEGSGENDGSEGDETEGDEAGARAE
ncbi:antitoxin Xre/MbcA/ParS toxin-binding domain-containing protein [Burkholderia cenocepacia]|uniref:antitoxin Xre/MbcA/ParS toxin-binding domain-containing protein n=1 Tax=Burkholderia cenocepacia TaxID=95486 RepID=UPI000761922E|nr:antitoxin Xre/MbcA/ParS toxin-binding domain-containing protein [Burkholderia cenocepacia]KWU24798.1 hypothetical protein AS149_32140 [Burkholderia cenocepacia]